MQDQETTEVTEAVSDEDKEDEGGHEVEDEGDVLGFFGFLGGFFCAGHTFIFKFSKMSTASSI